MEAKLTKSELILYYDDNYNPPIRHGPHGLCAWGIEPALALAQRFSYDEPKLMGLRPSNLPLTGGMVVLEGGSPPHLPSPGPRPSLCAL